MTKRLKDILESKVDEKYFLSDKMLEYFDTRAANFNNGNINFKDEESVASTITSSSKSLDISDNIIKLKLDNQDFKIVGDLNKGGERGIVFCENSKLMNCLTATDYKQPKQIQINQKEITSEETEPHVTISKEVRTEDSKAKRRETGTNDFRGKEIEFREQDVSNTITTQLTNDHYIKIGAIRGRQTNPNNPKEWVQTLGLNDEDISNNITTVQKDNMVVNTELKQVGMLSNDSYNDFSRRIYDANGLGRTLMGSGGNCNDKAGQYEINQRIRRLTPTECFRLMDFNENFKWNVSDSQAYKQAGNSIVVSCLVEIIKKLKL